MTRRPAGSWPHRLVLWWPWLLALLVMAPVLPRGFALTYDMVFVPRQPLVPESLGLGGPLPRAVPVDALVSLATAVVPGDWVQVAVLVAIVGAAGAGAARAVPSDSRLAALAAATAYAWNPYVAERLVIGQWTLLLAYAVLPWLYLAMRDLRSGRPGALARVVLLLVPGAVSPAGALLSLFVVVPCLLLGGTTRVRFRQLGSVLGAWLVVNAPWWLPGALHPTGGVGAGTDVFTVRSEGPLGLPGTLASLGGIWNAQVVPASRAEVLGWVWVLGVLAVVVTGACRWLRTTDDVGRGLWVGAAAGVAVAVLPVLPGGSALLSLVTEEVPGAALMRDGHRLLAPFALASALAFGAGVAHLATRPRRFSPALVGGVLAVLPIVALPDLAWGAAGRLAAVDYPADWSVVADLVDDDPDQGDVAVLPWQPYRTFAWNDHRPQLDPAPRWFSSSTVVSDDLRVGDVVVEGEDPRSRAVGRALEGRAPLVESLPELGVGWVLVEHGTPGAVPRQQLRGADPVFEGQWLTLYRLPEAEPWPLPWFAGWVLAADLLAALLILGAAGVVVRSRRRSGSVDARGTPRTGRDEI